MKPMVRRPLIPLLAGLLVTLCPAAGSATQFRPFLADTALRDTDPAPSPDGKWIAFQRNAKGKSQIWLAPTGGGKPHRLTAEPDSSSGKPRTATRVMTPTWAPDSRSLLFVSTRSGPYNIYSIGVDGGPVRPLSKAAGSQRYPVYSPDGTKICFPSSRLNPNSLYGFNLYLMDAKGEIDGPPARQLTFSQGGPGHPVWSPYGEWIAYVSKDFDSTRTVNLPGGMQTKQSVMFSHFHVFRVPAAGGREVQLTGLDIVTDPYEDTWPAWSPDGKWIAYGRNLNGKHNVWVLNVTTNRAFQLTTDGNCMKPNWSHDGQALYYTRLKGTDEDIWVATNLSLESRAAAASRAKRTSTAKTAKK